MTKPRNYSKEYKDFHGKPEQIKKRAMRNAAVKKLGRKGKSTQDGKEVDHKKPLRSGGGNGDSNLRVISRTANRKKA